MPDYYRILGVPRHASADEIKRAYRQLARRHHPDVSGEANAGRFREITRAYEVLSDERQRRLYDREREIPVRATVTSRDWFADEVAIDFPSVGAILERMRETFFGSDALMDSLSAEILLTPAEAVAGTMVPLDVPVRATCPRCDGRGETWGEVCHGCAGSGEASFRRPILLRVPPGVRHGARFRLNITSPDAPSTVVDVRIAVR